MRLSRFLISLVLATVISLVYVHQQVELVKLSYALNSRETDLKHVLDRKESLGYNIKSLESPPRLEDRLLAQKVDIVFPKKGQVVRTARGVQRAPEARERLKASGVERKVNIFWIFDFLSPRAEAQTGEK
jgi:hypothetical protein